MEEMAKLAAHTGLDQEETELVVGGLLSILKKSKNLDNNRFKATVEKFTGFQEALKKYEGKECRKKLPNPAMMLLPRPGFAPPGPPPPVIVAAAAKGIRKALPKDKDAGNTKDTIQSLTKAGVDEKKILTFVPVFIMVLKEKADVDVGDIIRLPSDDTEGGEAVHSG